MVYRKTRLLTFLFLMIIAACTNSSSSTTNAPVSEDRPFYEIGIGTVIHFSADNHFSYQPQLGYKESTDSNGLIVSQYCLLMIAGPDVESFPYSELTEVTVSRVNGNDGLYIPTLEADYLAWTLSIECAEARGNNTAKSYRPLTVGEFKTLATESRGFQIRNPIL